MTEYFENICKRKRDPNPRQDAAYPFRDEMETILEQQRRYHEERERLIKLMVDEYATKKPSVSA